MECPICGLKVTDHEVFNGGEMWKIECPRCGEYKHTDSTRGKFDTLSDTNRIKLITVLRNNDMQGHDAIELDMRNIMGVVDSYTDLTVPEKIDSLMLNLSSIVSQPNEIIILNESIDWPLAYSKDQSELTYYIDHLKNRNLLEFIKHNQEGNQFKITVMGWEHISALQKKPTTSKKVFVAMNFDEEFDNLYEKSIKLAIEDNGYKSIISNREEHVELIDDFIMTQIKESRFVVAEFTGQKHGVYFEAGYAKGLGKPVIWVCKEDEIEELHFDINHYNQIDWKTPEELKERLYNRIRNVIIA